MPFLPNRYLEGFRVYSPADSSRAVLTARPSDSDRDTRGAKDDALWAEFASAQTAAEFCTGWLSLQCLNIPRVNVALLLLEQTDGRFVPVAVWPSAKTDASHLVPAAQQCLGEKSGKLLREQPGAQVVMAYPVHIDGLARGALVLDVGDRTNTLLQGVFRQLQWGIGWLEAFLLRRQNIENAELLQRARVALDVLAGVGGHTRLEPMALALVNDLASRFSCSRVSLGVDRGGQTQLLAMSHSAVFEKKTQLVTSLESAMDEAIDRQRTVTCQPAAAAGDGVGDEVGGTSAIGESGRIGAAHREFAGRQAVCTVVLSSRGVGIGALCFERDASFTAGDVHTFEALGALLGPELENRAELHRWFAGRMADTLRGFARHLSDARRPGFRIGLALCTVLALGVLGTDGDYRIGARAVVEGRVQRAAVAPFDGFLREAPVRAGHVVRQGQMLASLDDRDLLLEYRRWLSERAQHEARYRDALARHERANANVAFAQMQAAQSQLALVETRLQRTRVLAPFDGVVISGDLSNLLGSPVEQGKLLFEIAPLDAYRVILKVEDRDIRDVRPGQSGQLVLSGLAGQTLDFEVLNISAAESEDGKNVFRVEAQLERSDIKLRPGMEGVGKIHAGQQSRAWIWTHRLTDWLRMQAWSWLP